MRLVKPFVKLPFTFDHERLAAEISQFGEEQWRPHPSGLEGNSSLVLVSTNGEDNDDFIGPMKATARLEKTPYIRQIMAQFDSVVGRSRLMRLAPGAAVTQHTDAHYFWRNHLRIHVPIITDPAVAFYCEDEQVHMAAGESWTFDNWRFHSVENRSEITRIHLVIDTVGSGELWKMINGAGLEPERVNFREEHAPELRFESYRGLPVMPSTELRGDLEQLLGDIAEDRVSDTQMKEQLRARSADFLHDWHSHWMVHGPTAAGMPGYTDLRDAFRKDIESLPDHLALESNGYSFKHAVLYTLDAALNPRNIREETVSGAPAVSTSTGRPDFDRPVFIVAAPRSGSTLLFETLAVNRELWSVGDESHKHFERITTLRPSGKNPSNRLSADMASPDVIETLVNFFVADLIDSNGNRYAQLPVHSRPNEVRFLEKTPKNALRIPFILKAFPDARFIFLFRDARQNISSLLDSWRSRGYVTYSQLPGWPTDRPWSHLLIPGWQDLAGRSLAEVVTQQWLVTNRTILEDLSELPGERWCAVDYDSLLANTADELERLCSFAQIIFGPRMRQVAARPLKPSKYTLTPPQPGKWKKNAAELEPVIPATEELMATLRGLV